MINKTLLIGITGGIGAGKSAVANLYARMGYPVFSADTLAREVAEPGSPALEEIRAAFGNKSLAEDGTLNRAWLREKIALHPELRLKLEAITHPRIQARFKELAEAEAEKGAKIVFYEAPLLFEAKSENHLDAVITVHAPDDVRLQRVLQRDGGEREVVEKLLASQLPQEEKMRRAHYLIENNGSETELKNAAFAVLAQVRKRIGEEKPVPKNLIYAGIGAVLLILLAWSAAFFWGAGSPGRRVAEPAIRAQAREILRNAHENASLLRRQNGKFPDSAEAFFGANGAFACENCRHYIFALQAPCESGGVMHFYEPGEKELVDDLKGMQTSIQQGLDGLTLPCKPEGQGYNAFAAGMASPEAPLDILTIGEDGEVRVIQDGFGTGVE